MSKTYTLCVFECVCAEMILFGWKCVDGILNQTYTRTRARTHAHAHTFSQTFEYDQNLWLKIDAANKDAWPNLYLHINIPVNRYLLSRFGVFQTRINIMMLLSRSLSLHFIVSNGREGWLRKETRSRARAQARTHFCIKWIYQESIAE